MPTLLIDTELPLTEIKVVDNQFRVLGTGLGKMELNVAVGIYKVKFRSGSRVEEQFVPVIEGQQEVRVSRPSIQALPGVASFYSAGSGPRIWQARKGMRIFAPTYRGAGSQLTVFVHNAMGHGRDHRLQRSAILGPSGEEIFPLESVTLKSGELKCLGNLSVNPACYAISVPAHDGGEICLALPTTQGWDTQIYLECSSETETASDGCFIDLSASAITMRPERKYSDPILTYLAESFEEKEDVGDHLQTIELARNLLFRLKEQDQDSAFSVGLTHDHITESLEQENDTNPIFSIIMAHLMIAEKLMDHPIFKRLLASLRNKLGPLPDVLALAGLAGEAVSVSEPPILKASFDGLVKTQPDAFAFGSPSAKFAKQQVYAGPYFAWRRNVSVRTISDQSLSTLHLIAKHKAPLPVRDLSSMLALPSLESWLFAWLFDAQESDDELTPFPWSEALKQLDALSEHHLDEDLPDFLADLLAESKMPWATLIAAVDSLRTKIQLVIGESEEGGAATGAQGSKPPSDMPRGYLARRKLVRQEVRERVR